MRERQGSQDSAGVLAQSPFPAKKSTHAGDPLLCPGPPLRAPLTGKSACNQQHMGTPHSPRKRGGSAPATGILPNASTFYSTHWLHHTHRGLFPENRRRSANCSSSRLPASKSGTPESETAVWTSPADSPSPRRTRSEPQARPARSRLNSNL